MELEKLGLPVVNFVTEWFVSLAEATKKGKGLPDHRLVVLPREIEKLSREEVIAVADKVFDQVAAALTAPALVRVSRKQP